MGFGHRVYKNYDPRAKIIKQIADQVFEVKGRNPLLDIALELERIALEDDYFIKRKLYPNVDFYSGLIYQSMGLPMDMFPVLVRYSANLRVDRAVGRNAHRSRTKSWRARSRSISVLKRETMYRWKRENREEPGLTLASTAKSFSHYYFQ